MVPSALACTSLAGESVRHVLDAQSKMGAMRFSESATLHGGTRRSLHMVHEQGRIYCTVSSDQPNPSQDNQQVPQQQQPPPLRTNNVSYHVLSLPNFLPDFFAWSIVTPLLLH